MSAGQPDREPKSRAARHGAAHFVTVELADLAQAALGSGVSGDQENLFAQSPIVRKGTREKLPFQPNHKLVATINHRAELEVDSQRVHVPCWLRSSQSPSERFQRSIPCPLNVTTCGLLFALSVKGKAARSAATHLRSKDHTNVTLCAGLDPVFTGVVLY